MGVRVKKSNILMLNREEIDLGRSNIILIFLNLFKNFLNRLELVVSF